MPAVRIVSSFPATEVIELSAVPEESVFQRKGAKTQTKQVGIACTHLANFGTESSR
jgi:hypothetical protein